MNAKKPKPPQIFFVKELDKTSWKLVIFGSWKYALEQRKQGMLNTSKMINEKQKAKDKQQYRAISWLSKLGKWVAYLTVALTVFSLVAPAIAMNYIS